MARKPATASPKINPLDHMGLVHSVVVRMGYHQSNTDYDDAVQDGSLGLLHAVEKFDLSKGVKFSTYASHIIWAYVMRARAVGVPEHAYFRDLAGARAVQRPMQFMLTGPGADFSSEFAVPAPGTPISDSLESAEVSERLAAAMESLPTRDRQILFLKYWQGWTLKEIGNAVRSRGGRTLGKERIRQCINAAEEKLRELLVEKD